MEYLDISSIFGSHNSTFSLEDRGREILVISIGIGNGKTDEITIHENDTPRCIAKVFCNKHNLSPEAEKVIIRVVKDNLKTKPVVEASKITGSLNCFEKNKGSKRNSLSIGKKDTGKTSERNSLDFSTVLQSVVTRNTGERLYKEAVQHKEQYNQKISMLKEKLEKEKNKEITFKPRLISEKNVARLSFIENEGVKGVDPAQIPEQTKKSTSNKQSPVRLPSPGLSEKILKSRKLLQNYLDHRGRTSKIKFRSQTISKERPKRVFRSQSGGKRVKLSNEQTDKIINRLKVIRFIQLFDNLNPNDKQEINKKTIEHPKVTKRVQDILKPFFEELRGLNLSLNLEEFCNVMELYLKDLTPEERSTLLQIGKKNNKKTDFRLGRELKNDLWSPKQEQKLLAFEQFLEYG